MEERVREDLDRFGLQFERQVALASERGQQHARHRMQRHRSGRPVNSGADEFMTTIVEMPAGASNWPSRTVSPSSADSTASKMTLLVPESGVVKSDVPLG